jgi:hypothetical protein
MTGAMLNPETALDKLDSVLSELRSPENDQTHGTQEESSGSQQKSA